MQATSVRGGQKVDQFDPRFLAKTEIDCVIDANRAEALAGLRRIAAKLYKRNPNERKKSVQPSVEAALLCLFSGHASFA